MTVREKLNEVLSELLAAADEAYRAGSYSFATDMMGAANHILEAKIILADMSEEYKEPGENPAHLKMNGVHTP